MKKTLLLCAFLVGLVSSNVMALTLDEARTQGRVGETFYGYLVALKTDAETEKLVADINAERKASGFAPIFPDTCYHLTHYWPAAADIPV
ncbi:YdbL family protein, partial [Escherichia coli]|nr:YdbL family protein [Escherichia coli]